MLAVATITASSAGGRFVADKPTLTHTSAGQFTIGNYNPLFNYTLSNVSATRSGNLITLSSSNMSTNVSASSTNSVSGSEQGYAERLAYTYYYGTSTSCSLNCRAIGGNCFQGTGSCQGDGSCGADGTICCGGSAGQTCTTVSTGPFLNGTPAGYLSQYGEWSKVL